MTPSERIRSSWALPSELFDRLIATAALDDPVRSNRHLSSRQWCAAYSKKLPIKTAEAMAAAPLDAERLDHLIEVETRAGMLLAAMSDPALLTAEVVARLAAKAAKTKSGKLAAALFRHGVPADVATTLYPALPPAEKVTYLAYIETDEDVIVDEVRSIDTWWVRYTTAARNQALGYLVNTRPHLLERLVADPIPHGLRQTLAGSRLMLGDELQTKIFPRPGDDGFKYIVIALAYNPVSTQATVSAAHATGIPEVRERAAYRLANASAPGQFITVPFEQLSDQAEIVAALRRCLPDLYGYSKRPFDLVALAHNEHLSPVDAQRVLDALASNAPGRVPGSMSAPAVAALVDRFGLDCPAVDFDAPVEHMLRPAVTVEDHDDGSSWYRPAPDTTWDDVDVSSIPTERLTSVPVRVVQRVEEYVAGVFGADAKAYEALLAVVDRDSSTIESAVRTAKLLARR